MLRSGLASAQWVPVRASFRRNEIKEPTTMNLLVRDATIADLPAIVAIYNQSIPTGRSTADLAPISVDERIEWFGRFDPLKRPIWVALDDTENIVACIYLTSFYGGRAAYDKTAEVSLYIDSDWQNRGVGSWLMEKMIAHCPQLDVTTLIGMHFDHNEATRKLNEKFGFKVVGHLPEIAEIHGEKRGLLLSILRIEL
jgi:phosphinothricin acetyltransferase